MVVVVDGGAVVGVVGGAGRGGGVLVITDWILTAGPGVLLPAQIIRLPGPAQTEHLKPLVYDDLPEDHGVLHQREEDEEHAGEEPDLQGRDGVGDGDPGGGGVEHVYQDQTESDQQDNPRGNHVLQ